jgi:hypothetical protein
MKQLSMLWRRITATRYTRALEIEVARLRAENRALLNSILGIAGMPPIPVNAGELAGDAVAGELGMPPQASQDAKPSGKTAHSRKATGAQVTPVRRRSWHQINRILEIQSAKKKPQDPNS